MKILLPLLLVSFACSTTTPFANGASIVDPLVYHVLKSNDSVPVWIFFKDKGTGGSNAALRDLENTYNQRAISRRMHRRTAPGLFDDRDLPVSESMIGQITQIVGSVRTRSRWLNAVSAEVSRDQVRAIAQLPFVRAIKLVRRSNGVDPLGEHPVAQDPLQSGAGNFYGLAFDQLQTINLPPVHTDGWTGEGIVIGILDTGFKRTHSAFAHPNNPLQVIAEYDFINDDPQTGPEAGDDSSQHVHGTIILGTLAGYAPDTYVGAAYNAAYILCKTEDITGEYQGEEDFYVAGLEFIEANGGDVATSSLTYLDWYTQADMDGMTGVTTIAVNVATANGLHCCTAVGNGGHDQNPTTSHLGAPADAFQVFSVGSVNIFGEESGFSSDGPTADGRTKPEILTVGESAVSVSPSDDNGYIEASGTSLATPMMAGAVACLVQSRPSLTVDAMRDGFLFTASDYVLNGTYDPAHVRGYGVVDAHAALGATRGNLATIVGLEQITGTILSGDIAEILASDDAYLQTRSGFGSTLVDLHHMQTEFSMTTTATNPTSLDVLIESHISEQVGTAQIRLFNYNSGQFDQVRQYALSPVDQLHSIAGIDATDHVGPNGEIRLRVKHIVFVPFLAFTFESFIDHVQIEVHE